jgi:TPR repeat protein
MSLEDVIPDSSLELRHYYAVPWLLLEKLEDAESIFERGRRLRYGFGVDKDKEAGWAYVIRAAQLRHPVALGLCNDYGRGITKNHQRAVELYRDSAHRGHPAGELSLRRALCDVACGVWRVACGAS